MTTLSAHAILGEAVPAQAALGNVTAPAGRAANQAPSCPTCGSHFQTMSAFSASSAYYAYAFGRIEPRFPNIGVEKEFAQFASRAPSTGVDDAAFIRSVLSDPGAQYLARQLCWVFSNQDRDCFVVAPRDQNELDNLIESFASSKENTIVVVVGRAVVGAGWAPETGEAALPRFGADQLIHFDIDEFVSRVPRSADLPEDEFKNAVRSVFGRIHRRSENTGITDDHRALNYLALRYPVIFEVTTRAAAKSLVLASIDARAQTTGDVRRIVTVRFNFRGPGNGFIEKYNCRVDVTEEFPFILSPFQQIFDD
jgi:hypothetical protein